MNPNNLSVKELIHYGDQHSDPWVKRLADVLFAVSFHVPDNKLEYLDAWFEDEHDTKIKNLEWEIEDQELTITEQQSEINDLAVEVKSLRFETEEQFKSSRINSEIRGLKAYIVDLEEEFKKEKDYHSGAVRELEELHKAHKKLKDKYNTWQVIAN